MTASIVVAIQARMGSSRLPGKVLADLAGRPMLALQLERLAPLSYDHLVIATSDHAGDDPVARLAAEHGAEVVRGPEGDVLARYGAVIDRYRPDHVVRLTGDCPFSDPEVVRQAVDEHLGTGAAYTSNLFPRTYPEGLDVEVATVDALQAAIAEAVDPSEREHVMPFLYRRPERFAMANVGCDQDLGEEWWVVDTADDLESARLLAAMVDDPARVGWRELLAAAGRRRPTAPGEVHLSPLAPAEPGSHPWVRSWEARRNGSRLAVVRVSVGTDGVARTIDSRTDAWREGDDEAVLDVLQARPGP